MLSATIPDGQATTRRAKLRKIATAARAVALFGIVLVAGYQGYLLFNPKLLISSLNIDAWPTDLSPSSGAQILGWLISLLPSALFVAAMLNVRTLFAILARGSIFDPEISHLLRRIGKIAVAAALLAFVGRTLTVLVITMASPGSPHFVIGISSEEITAFVVGLLLLAFAYVMQEVVVMDEENRSFV